MKPSILDCCLMIGFLIVIVALQAIQDIFYDRCKI